MAEPRILKV